MIKCEIRIKTLTVTSQTDCDPQMQKCKNYTFVLNYKLTNSMDGNKVKYLQLGRIFQQIANTITIDASMRLQKWYSFDLSEWIFLIMSAFPQSFVNANKQFGDAL